jgi:uncharacterized protein (TIGR02646 family)
MIRITRPPEPKAFLAERFGNAREKIRKIVEDEERKPLSKEFPSYWSDPDIKETLWEMQHGKCCYCERARDVDRETDVEHFRPKAGVTGADGGYWWLAYRWPNLFLSCKPCNESYKKNYFPIWSDELRAAKPGQDLGAERALLIDPVEVDPEQHLIYTLKQVTKAPDPKDAKAKPTLEQHVLMAPFPGSDKGQQTIEVCRLNRGELTLRRGTIVDAMVKAVEALAGAMRLMNREFIDLAAGHIRVLTSSENNEFVGYRRYYFRQLGYDQYVADD